jgi:hypothetical protein
MKQHQLYTPESDCRQALEAVLDEYGYALAAFALADKPEDDERTVTLKATRNLGVKQERLPLQVQG